MGFQPEGVVDADGSAFIPNLRKTMPLALKLVADSGRLVLERFSNHSIRYGGPVIVV